MCPFSFLSFDVRGFPSYKPKGVVHHMDVNHHNNIRNGLINVMHAHKPCTVSTSLVGVHGSSRSLCPVALCSRLLRSCSSGNCKPQSHQTILPHRNIAASAEGGDGTGSGADSGSGAGDGRGNNGLHRRHVISIIVDANSVTPQRNHPLQWCNRSITAASALG